MPIYVSDQFMYSVFQQLFDRTEAADPTAAEDLIKSGLVISFNCKNPTARVTFDASQEPLKISYGANGAKPQIAIGLSADTLHCILLGELGIRKAMGRGLLDLQGPVWKVTVLAELFQQTQSHYPVVLHEYGLPGNCPSGLS